MPAVQHRRMLLVFAAWTLLVWGGRVVNVVNDADLDAGGRAARLALAASFVGLGLAVAVLAWRNRSLTHRQRLLVGVAIGWTIAVWLVRSAQTVAGDHSTSFIVVHLVLAAVSIGLAVAVIPALRHPALPFGHSGGQAAGAARR